MNGFIQVDSDNYLNQNMCNVLALNLEFDIYIYIP